MNISPVNMAMQALQVQGTTPVAQTAQAGQPQQLDTCCLSLSAQICLSVHEHKKHERDVALELSVTIQAVQQAVMGCPMLQVANGMVGMVGAGGMTGQVGAGMVGG